MARRKQKQARENALLDELEGKTEDIELVSKTEMKRIMTGLQELGQTLMEMNDGEYAKISVPDNIDEAIQTAKRIKSNEGRRRQLQFIGKQMRELGEEKTEAIAEAVQALRDGNRAEAKQFQQLEKQRDTLIKQGDPAVEALLQKQPELDRQLLRQLVRQAQREASTNKAPASARKLFKYLREASAL